LLQSVFWACPIPSFPRTLGMSSRAAIWIAARQGGRAGGMQNGPEVERVMDRGGGFMKLDKKQDVERILQSAVVVSWQT
jgi:hypothetical protein